ncbi:penicillin acylase family protein [Algoriphagus pacificus]|uniref:Penicillin acylase family protein n=1 Tax=Algoriphagus pacificus TaxID=2811234 RepID=A0ABS3CKG2_9BACT|nr:penicillin acylase family protein [Algoriphagus pacificus]MBN7817596.1 penicillin acylase family protein [Algoriphagus pacificus]
MKYFSFIFVLILTVALAWVISNPIGPVPPIAPLIDPYHGFWQNMYSEDELAESELILEGLTAPVQVVYDENLIPHIFAENDLDLYTAQGYITAKHRLWQMEFQTRAAAGRISEIVGDVALELDRMTRRKGLGYGAELGLEFLQKNDPETLSFLEAYANGVNQYINTLTPAQTPVEYKILNYKPETWTAYKSLLLLKYMSDMLVGDRDLEYSNLRKVLGEELLNKLYPDFPVENDPVIEAEKVWDFTPIEVQKPDSTNFPNDDLVIEPLPQPEKGTGSNNWAVSGSKTKNGNPILANDPHLSLNLPSLWYAIQLTTPAYSVKGASLPGALGVISGFNQNIAWGVTNATKDARDWYKITFQDDSRKAYKYGEAWRETTFRIEEIKIKGKEAYLDTVVYTHYGPVVYDKSFRAERQDVNFALKWTVHMGSNEQKTFLKLNKAKNHADYNEALDNFTAPAQNFVFASKSGDIAMRIQGKFALKWPEQGKFFMDGADPKMEWQGFIPNDQNPSTLNPERGFVASANQHPVDPSYPYYVFDNSYEHYRNRRINGKLRQMDQITVEDMKTLQFDDYYTQASEALPLMINLLGTVDSSDEKAQVYLKLLSDWDFYADPNQKAPTLYYIWWGKLYDQIWQEWEDFGVPVVKPNSFQTIQFLKNEPEGSVFDLGKTPSSETASTHVRKAFEMMLEEMKEWEEKEGDFTWANYKRTTIQHLVPQFKAFSVANVYTGGGGGIVNATSGRHGASWRMVVELADQPIAFGVYPGGQSGNPGSKYYGNFIPIWAEGKYLNFNLRNVDDSEGILFQTTLK